MGVYSRVSEMKFVSQCLGLTIIICSVNAAPAAPAAQENSKEELTNSLVALKSQSIGHETRTKRNDPALHESKNINNDDITEATLILARYILETGDVDGVMEFLQS